MRLAQGARTLGQRRGGGVDDGCEGGAPTAVVASVCRPVGDSVVCSQSVALSGGGGSGGGGVGSGGDVIGVGVVLHFVAERLIPRSRKIRT